MTLDNAYTMLYTGALVVLSTLTLFCLFRAILGPRIADRVVSINMIATMTLAMICVLSMVLDEGYLADVALIYALLGFLAVVVLCKIYMGVALEKRDKQNAELEAANAPETKEAEIHA